MTYRKRKITYFIIPILLSVTVFAVAAILLSGKILSGNEAKGWKRLIKDEVLIDHAAGPDYVYAIISGDGTHEYGDQLLVLRRNLSESWEIESKNDFSGLKPWKIDMADVDDDGEEEILIAVRKTTRYDSEEKNRMFIYNYTGGLLVRKWTGSQIAGTWRDFCAGQLFPFPGCELIFIEQTKDGRERIKVYNWFDFGFFLTAESGMYSYIENLSVTGENRLQATVRDEGGERTIVLFPDSGILTEENEK